MFGQRIFGKCTKRKALIIGIVAFAALSLIVGLSVGLRRRSESENLLNPVDTEAANAENADNTTASPSTNLMPSLSPSTLDFRFLPSSSPSVASLPLSPSFLPSNVPSLDPDLPVPNRTSFFVIGCVPYEVGDRDILIAQLSSLNASETDFLIHLGDIKGGNSDCSQDVLDDMDSILKLSPVPVFLVVGDNEFNDCLNISPDKALRMWRDQFVGFHSKYWSHNFTDVTTSAERPEIFSFLNKKTLFLGVNLVGGRVHDADEWESRHEDDREWIMDHMQEYQSEVHSVVIFGHADAGGSFFNPFVLFVRKQFPSDIPILYVCADIHRWDYEPGMLNLDNVLKVRISGGVQEPVVRITVDPETAGNDPVDAFQVERFLSR